MPASSAPTRGRRQGAPEAERGRPPRSQPVCVSGETLPDGTRSDRLKMHPIYNQTRARRVCGTLAATSWRHQASCRPGFSGRNDGPFAVVLRLTGRRRAVSMPQAAQKRVLSVEQRRVPPSEAPPSVPLSHARSGIPTCQEGSGKQQHLFTGSRNYRPRK